MASDSINLDIEIECALFREGVFVNLDYSPVPGKLELKLVSECDDSSDTPLELTATYTAQVTIT